MVIGPMMSSSCSLASCQKETSMTQSCCLTLFKTWHTAMTCLRSSTGHKRSGINSRKKHSTEEDRNEYRIRTCSISMIDIPERLNILLLRPRRQMHISSQQGIPRLSPKHMQAALMAALLKDHQEAISLNIQVQELVIPIQSLIQIIP